MYKSVKGRCSICNKKGDIHELGFKQREALVIDHNHDTGAVRGLLCFHCNLVIGHAMEDQGVLKEAIKYLKKHKTKRTTK